MQKELIKQAVKEALQEEIKPFYVDREIHYQHHEFIGELIQWSNKIKTTAIGTIVRTLIWGLIGLIILGFIFWGKGHFK
jgi:hypothetical protein